MIILVIVMVNAVAEVTAALSSPLNRHELVPSIVQPVVLPPHDGEVE